MFTTDYIVVETSVEIFMLNWQQMLAIDDIVVGWRRIFKSFQKINLLKILVADLRRMSTTENIVDRLWPIIEVCSKSW